MFADVIDTSLPPTVRSQFLRGTCAGLGALTPTKESSQSWQGTESGSFLYAFEMIVMAMQDYTIVLDTVILAGDNNSKIKRYVLYMI